MRRVLLGVVLGFVLMVSSAQAQGVYVGLGYSVPTRVLGQLGYSSGGGIGARASVQYAFGASAFLALGDVLYHVDADSIAPYLGAGGGLVAVLAQGQSATAFEVHATAGSEFFVTDGVALFAEVQPYYFVPPLGLFDVRLSLGANFHF